MFQLNKWYLDLISPDGIAVICYSARLRWGPLRLRYSSILLAIPGAKPEEASSIRQVERPRLADGIVHWRSDTLDVSGEWRRRQPPIRATLRRDHTGAIRWSCRLPLADAEVQWGNRRFSGLGYVESLGMTMPPTQLPFRMLRWGRHLSSEHSLVWIDWSGSAPGQWVWLDGVLQRSASFAADGSMRLPEGRWLQLHDSRDIRNATLLPSLLTAVPAVASRAAGALGTLHEHKMVSRSSLHDGQRPSDSGWTIHEIVTW